VLVGNWLLGYRRTPVIVKTATWRSASVMSTRSPGLSAPRRKNTDGPARRESTWPSMMAGPGWPGAGEYLYQAASSVSGGSLSGGTAMVPSGLRPTYRRLDLTPIAGIEIETGSDLASTRPCVAAGREPCAVGGAGMAPACAGPGWGACC